MSTHFDHVDVGGEPPEAFQTGCIRRNGGWRHGSCETGHAGLRMPWDGWPASLTTRRGGPQTTLGPSQHPHVTVHSEGTMVDISSRDVYRSFSIPDACGARLADPRLVSPLKTTASSKKRCHVTSHWCFRPEWHSVKLQDTVVSMRCVPLGPACDGVGFERWQSSCQKATLGKNPS